MPIIISKNGKDAKRVEKTSFKEEKELQDYITENPECIPFEDIKEDVQFVILDREFPVDVGVIDTIGVDSEGEIYIIETKLYKNPDKRRVLAQVIDYGASLWNSFTDEDGFIQTLSRRILDRTEEGLDKKLEDVFGESSEIIEGMKRNLKDGIYRFIILMDQVPSELKNLILYINQNSQFSVYSVELEYYKHQGYEILIPDVFGAEMKKKAVHGRQKWDEESFFDEVEDNLDNETIKAIKKLYEFTNKIADVVVWGTGVISGSFNPKINRISSRTLYAVKTNGEITINRWSKDKEEVMNLKNKICEELSKIEGLSEYIKGYKEKTYITIPAKAWTPVVDEIINVLKKLL